MRKLWWLLIVLLVGAGYWYATTSKPTVNATTPTTNTPTSWAQHVTIHEFNPGGQLSSHITATTMQNMLSKDTASNVQTWVKPRITTIDSSGLTWHIRANKGYSYNQSKLILAGDVYLHRLPNKKIINKPATTITTSTLTIFPKKSMASTDAAAKIVQPQQTITGTGMRVDFKTSKAKILHNSHAVLHNLGGFDG